MSEQEVVVTLDGLPRPATVIAREGTQVCVRYRFAGAFEERWVPAETVVTVERESALPSLPKVIGLVVLAVFGLTLLLWPSGNDTPLVPSGPTPTASQSR